MTRFRLPSWDALEALLRAGRIPAAVHAEPVRVGSDADGIWLQAALPPALREELLALGAEEQPAADDGVVLSCWAEALPLQVVPATADERLLFRVDADDLLDLAGELLRLGCDRQRWASSGEHAWIEALEPPWYTVLSALDGDGRRVYEPVGPDVWVRLGRRHPLQSTLQAPNGAQLLLDTPWQAVELTDWTALDDQLAIEAPPLKEHAAPARLPRLPVRLRLVDSGVSPAPTLWVLREDGPARLERLLEHLPDEIADRLLFAVSGDLALLRARPNPAGPPTLDLEAEACCPLLELPNVFRPTDATLEPPLRRERIRDLIAPAPDELAWLARTADGFRVERIAEEAFRPLAAWVDYVVSRDEEALQGWLGAASFDFGSWVDIGVEWSDRPPARTSRKKVDAPEEGPPPEDAAPLDEELPEPLPFASEPLRPQRVEIVADVERSALSAELLELEAAFRTSEAAPESPERRDLWRSMARLHRQLGNAREATLCWVHAVWDADDADLTRTWAEEELGAVGMDAPTLRDAVVADPRPALLRATGAVLAAGSLTGDATLAPLFDRSSEAVDVRTAWLARSALAADDELARARARDDLLQRIRQGLAVERDVPAFVRGFDADESLGVVEQLEGQLQHFRTTRRKRNVLEADPALTGAYVDLVFAWGFASAGDRERAERLVARSRSCEAIDRADVVHDALLSAYEARIEQALNGIPRDALLPAEASAKLAGLPDLERYQVDRLRSASGILESRERLNPFKTYERRFQDARGPEFAELRGVTEPSVLEPALLEIVDNVPGHGEAGRLIDGVLDFLPLLSAASAVPLLDRVLVELGSLPVVERAQLLTDALVVAGLLGRSRRARTLAGQLRDALAEVPVAELGALTDGLAGSLRSLRRVGLEEEARELLETVESALALDPLDPRAGFREDHTSRLVRASAVGGLLALRTEGALRELDVLLSALSETHTVVKRLQLTRALGLALAAAPRAEAFARLPLLSEHLPQITDGFGTNSHFCLSLIGYAESVVLGYADTELGSEARAWIDASEFRVRRRIHAARVSRVG